MYRILPQPGSLWTIVDQSEAVVFVGTLRECEDWLDAQDRARVSRSTQENSIRRFLRRLFRKSGASPPKPEAPDQLGGPPPAD